MAGPSKVIVLDPDARAAAQILLGFEREGIPVAAPPIPDDLAELAVRDPDSGIALVGGSNGQAVELVRRTRQLLHADVPIVFTGTGVPRDELARAGADEVVTRPAFLRDIVTIGRILRGQPAAEREHVAGSLAETTGVYTLVRALSALGRSAVLTMVRGLRRGEIRFYRGEVTSAQVGLIYGQAAFHQLLLWTDARFDFSREDIVRRQQIPLPADELFADAERFLEGVRETAELLSPAMVLEQDVERVIKLGAHVPLELHGVLRMFDGHHVLADVLEDSPYRVFETLRITQKALEAGLLRVVHEQRSRTSWRAVLAIEEWLVGNETREAVVERTASIETKRIAVVPPPGNKKRKPRRKKPRRAPTPLPIAAPKPGEFDWSALVPRVIGAEVGPFSTVVPAHDAAGEIDVVSRDRERERLEALMDTDKRNKIFPTEIGIEPSVVVDERVTFESKRVEVELPADVDASAKVEATADAEPEAARRIEAEDEKLRSSADGLAQAPPVTTTAPPFGAADGLAQRALAQVPPVEAAPRDELAKEPDAVSRSTAADEARAYAARVKALAEAKRLEAERVESERIASGGPSVLRDAPGETAAEPAHSEPAPSSGPASPKPGAAELLVADLAAAHSAIAAVVAKAAAAAPTTNAASPSDELMVAEVHRDAVELTATEVAFFDSAERSEPVVRPSHESFDDLDEGYQKPTFWGRVFGRKPPRH